VRLGFQIAGGDIIAFVDADGATPPPELRRLIAHLNSDDCVVASRWMPGAQVLVRQPPLRRLLGRGFNICVRALFGLRIADTQCGAKIFKRHVIEAVIEDVETADFAFDVDVLYQIRRRGWTIREVPTVWRDREGSTVNVMVAAPRMLASIVRLRLLHSPFRVVIPFFDKIFDIRTIKCRRLLRILVVSRTPVSDLDASSDAGRFHVLVQAYRSETRTVEWWTPSGRGPAALEYFSRHRAKFDCIVELTPDGRPFWSPLYSLKPVLTVGRGEETKRWPYADTEMLANVPDDVRQLEEALRHAMTRRDAYFFQEYGGEWTFHPRRTRPASAECVRATAGSRAN
jgi:hypothetical protein